MSHADTIARTASLYDRVKAFVPPMEWPVFADDIDAILALKRRRNAVILGHNYMTPEIFHCVSDIVGDSLALAREAMKVDADVIVLAGVHFMAETAKLMNPSKTVLIPDTRAGCSLAASITAADVRLLRERYPGVPVVTYVNTSAAVKAESDICCTSGNARKVIESLGVERVIMLPDEYLAQNIAAQTGVKIITWAGRCEVHERFTAAQIRELRAENPGVVVLAHPECPPEVVAEADFTGSTADMSGYVGSKKPARVVLITECSMADNVSVHHPDVQFVRPCNLCPHMKRITLANIRSALEEMRYEVTIDPAVAGRARLAVERMLAVRSILPPLPAIMVEPSVRAALLEDLGRAGDLTTDAIVPTGARTETALMARQAGVVAGLDFAAAAFRLIDPAIEVIVERADGSRLAPGDLIAVIRGPARGILTAERTALNFLCHLSGIASATRGIVDAIAGTKAQVVCTRKTMPGLRAAQKYAVRVGGGSNHRFGLDDAVLIKDNHVAIAGGVRTAVERARAGVGHLVKIELEVDTLAQLQEAMALGVDAVLLDNMGPDLLRQAVEIVGGRAITEASGRIRPDTAPAIAAAGVDLLSAGWLTHSVTVLDIGLDHRG